MMMVALTRQSRHIDSDYKSDSANPSDADVAIGELHNPYPKANEGGESTAIAEDKGRN